MFKYLTDRALKNLEKSFGDYQQFKIDRIFHTVTLYIPEEKNLNKNLEMYFISPSFEPIQKMMINRFPNDFLRAMSDHIITSKSALQSETNLGYTGLKFFNDIEDELTPLCYKANMNRYSLTGEIEGINKDIHVLVKNYQEIEFVQNTYKKLSENPMINLHFYMPQLNKQQQRQNENKALQLILQKQDENVQESSLMISSNTVNILNNDSPYLNQMIETIKQVQRLRSQNQIKQGSKKILIDIGHNANGLYGQEKYSRIVDELVVIMVRGDVPKKYLGRKFVDLQNVMKFHECEYETQQIIKEFGENKDICVKLLRFQQTKTVDEAVDEYLEDSSFKYKHLFSKTKK